MKSWHIAEQLTEKENQPTILWLLQQLHHLVEHCKVLLSLVGQCTMMVVVRPIQEALRQQHQLAHECKHSPRFRPQAFIFPTELPANFIFFIRFDSCGANWSFQLSVRQSLVDHFTLTTTSSQSPSTKFRHIYSKDKTSSDNAEHPRYDSVQSFT